MSLSEGIAFYSQCFIFTTACTCAGKEKNFWPNPHHERRKRIRGKEKLLLLLTLGRFICFCLSQLTKLNTPRDFLEQEGANIILAALR
jgi:hypothetical protein